MAHVMQLYREINGTVDKDGTKKLAALVNYIDAVMHLSSHPKHFPAIGKLSSSTPAECSSSSSHMSSDAVCQLSCNQKSHEDSGNFCNSPSSERNIAMAALSRSRPRGIKREKSENASEAGAFKMAKSIDRVGMEIENSTNAKLIASSVSIRFKIIKSLPLSDEERGSKLMQLLSKASSMNAGQHEKVKPLLKMATQRKSLN